MRKKLSENQKRVDVNITIDSDLYKILEKYLEENDISNRSKYIEKLIRNDFEKRGKNIEIKF